MMYQVMFDIIMALLIAMSIVGMLFAVKIILEIIKWFKKED